MANAKNNPAGFLPLAQFQPHGALTRVHRIWFVTGNQVIQGPNIHVPPGSSVTFRPIAEDNTVNKQAVLFSEHPESLGVASATNIVPPAADVSLPFTVGNLQQLWFSGAQFDGLIISVSIPAVG